MSQSTDLAPAPHHGQPQQAQQHPQQQQPEGSIHAHPSDPISSPNPRRILFLYGSQTGCAQDVAENAAREARRMHFSAAVSAMDNYDRVRKTTYTDRVKRERDQATMSN